jgi:hypothetical protein
MTGGGRPTSVLVCRGCCCGTVGKHPDVDHVGQLARLRAALPDDGSRVWEVDCLGPCERSNVVVVRRGRRRRWFGEVLDQEDTGALAAWLAAGPGAMPPARLAAREFDPDDVTPPLEPLALTGERLALTVEAMLGPAGLGAGGAWVFGVEGATAEIAVAGEPVEVRRTGQEVEAVTAGGAVRLRLTAGARLFVAPGAPTGTPVVLGVPRGTLPPAPDAVSVLGADVDAIRRVDRTGTLVDLGLGHRAASFAVRAEDGHLLDLLRRVAGQPWPAALDVVGEALVAASPVRVVRTALGRAEVSTSIPLPGAGSPSGPHTHLLPPQLELGRELPVGLSLPPGLAPAGTFHPPPGWDLTAAMST